MGLGVSGTDAALPLVLSSSSIFKLPFFIFSDKMEVEWNDAFHPRFDKWVEGLNSNIFRNSTPTEKDQFLRTGIGYFGLTASQVNNLVRLRWLRKNEDYPQIREDSEGELDSTSVRSKLSCINESDPFNFEDFSDMDPKYIITIGRYCFHLPSIYNWILNLNNKTNPLTNIPFTDAEIREIKLLAMHRFPLRVTIKWINGKNVEFQTSSLDSVANFAIKLHRNDSSISKPIGSLYRLIILIGSRSTKAILKIDEAYMQLQEALIENETTSLHDLGVSNSMDVIMISIMNARESLPLTCQYRRVLENHGWPTDELDNRIRVLEQAIDSIERGNDYL